MSDEKLILSGETITIAEPSYGEYIVWKQQFQGSVPTSADWMGFFVGRDAGWVNSLRVSEGAILHQRVMPVFTRVMEAFGYVEADSTVRQH